MLSKVYIYPTYNPARDKSGNQYIKNFKDAFSNNSYSIRQRLWRIGVLSVFLNLSAKIFIFHWVDLIAKKRFGKIQFLIFLFVIIILKITNKDIYWVLHNKQPHSGYDKLTSFAMSLMAKYSNRIIVHSTEGIRFFKNTYPKLYGKDIKYIPHPVYSQEVYQNNQEIEWDYIIWGGINKHKRITEFLEFVKENDFFRNKKILICGKCSNNDYDSEIKYLLSENITYLNEFISDADLVKYIKRSKTILFTYNPVSVLSSGALIYSFNFLKRIIGPNVGSFSDFPKIVDCFDTFEDIISIDVDKVQDEKELKRYLNENTWVDLPKKILE